jgi:hypothetical protein
MTKTAEEILNQHLNRSITDGVSMWDSVVNAANEYGDLRAAQEAEAYKERLKMELYTQLPHTPGLRKDIELIIDVVK